MGEGTKRPFAAVLGSGPVAAIVSQPTGSLALRRPSAIDDGAAIAATGKSDPRIAFGNVVLGDERPRCGVERVVGDGEGHLRAAKALIDAPEKWTKNAVSRIGDDGSVSFCMVGALDHVRNRQHFDWDTTKGALMEFVPAGYTSLAMFNNARTTAHADVMALFDRAIEAAERESQ